jgi:SAM-dependent methyltransferase
MPPSLRVPVFLKRLLLPAWNGGHRFAWRVGEYLDAFRRRRFERCAVCGRFGPVLYRRWVIPPKLEALWGLTPAQAEALARKESSNCFACGAKERARRLARVLLALYPVGDPPAPARSIRQWVRDPGIRRLRVAEINRIDGLHDELTCLPEMAFSEFRDEAGPEVADDIPSEDLTRLSYRDGSFDLIVTSETLEHVPDLDAALWELRRVLRPGAR